MLVLVFVCVVIAPFVIAQQIDFPAATDDENALAAAMPGIAEQPAAAVRERHATNVITATAMTAGTNHADTRSASF